jgi:DNA-binding response OmpR family regulator
MNILIAEDNAPLCEGLAYVLRKAGHRVAIAVDGADALQRLADTPVELLVLDFNLPKVSGAEVLRQVRARPAHLPVLLFSALDDAQARLLRLGLEVDDMLVKPFAVAEFEARVAAFDRPDAAAYGPLTVDAAGAVRVRGAAVALRADERAVLTLLLQCAAGTVAADEIARRVAIGSDAVDACIERLRFALGPSGVRIVKVRGLGYCLAGGADTGADAAA